MKEGLGVQKKSQLHTGSAESEEEKKRAEKTKIGEKKGGDREWRKKTPSASVGGAEES